MTVLGKFVCIGREISCSAMGGYPLKNTRFLGILWHFYCQFEAHDKELDETSHTTQRNLQGIRFLFSRLTAMWCSVTLIKGLLCDGNNLQVLIQENTVEIRTNVIFLLQLQQQCPPRGEIAPCTCTVKKNGLDILCEFTDPQHIENAMGVLKGKTLVIFYLKLRHNNLRKLPGFVFLGLDIRHLTIHNSSLSVVEEASLSSIGKKLFHNSNNIRCEGEYSFSMCLTRKEHSWKVYANLDTSCFQQLVLNLWKVLNKRF